MKYQTIEGIVHDLDTLTSEERRIFDDMYKYSLTAPTWISIMQPHIFHRHIVDIAQKALETKWQEHPLYRINLDLIGRIGVRTGNLDNQKNHIQIH